MVNGPQILVSRRNLTFLVSAERYGHAAPDSRYPELMQASVMAGEQVRAAAPSHAGGVGSSQQEKRPQIV